MQLSYDSKKYIFPLKICVRHWNENLPIVSIGTLVCQVLKIPDEAEVCIQKLQHLPLNLSKVVVDPYNEEDWDILVKYSNIQNIQCCAWVNF